MVLDRVRAPRREEDPSAGEGVHAVCETPRLVAIKLERAARETVAEKEHAREVKVGIRGLIAMYIVRQILRPRQRDVHVGNAEAAHWQAEEVRCDAAKPLDQSQEQLVPFSSLRRRRREERMKVC